MPGDLQAIMNAAEQAAAANDFPSAARHLRDAARLQESALGPANADLANTLNNLGVVSERLGEIEEAERCFRRAYAIATSALPEDHPFVATSRTNLEDFCRLYSRSFEEPGESKDRDAPVESEEANPFASEEQDPVADSKEQDVFAASAEQDQAYERSAPTREAARLGEGEPSSRSEPYRGAVPVDPPPRGIPFGAVAVAAIAILALVIGWIAWPSRTLSSPPQVDTRAAPPPSVASPAPAPSPPETATAPPSEPKPAPPSTSTSTAPTSRADATTVADARLCRTLSTSGAWQCDAVTGDVAPGPIYFFTRIVAERATTVEHRWYFDDQLRQNVMLSIQPNSAGYRTYSRTTIPPERAGQWRVEVRTEEGRVLGEQHFTVR